MNVRRCVWSFCCVVLNNMMQKYKKYFNYVLKINIFDLVACYFCSSSVVCFLSRNVLSVSPLFLKRVPYIVSRFWRDAFHLFENASGGGAMRQLFIRAEFLLFLIS